MPAPVHNCGTYLVMSLPTSTQSRHIPGLRRLLTTAVLCLLTACAAPLPRLEAPLPAQWQHALAADPAKPVDLHGWWHAFGDSDLDALVGRALASNLDVATAMERLRAVRRLQQHAHARYLPNLGFRTDQTIDPDASGSFLVVGFDSTWELGLFGRAEGTRREAQGELDASQADLQTARVTLVAEVVRQWINLRAAQQQERLLIAINALREQQYAQMQTRERLHLQAPGSVAQAQAALEQSRSALAAPRQAMDASAWQLAVLVGQNHPDSSWLQVGTQPDLGSWQVVAAPLDLLRTRPDIAHAQAEVLRSAGESDLTHANLFPSVGFGGSMIWASDLINNRPHSVSEGLVTVGPALDIPLFNWGMREAAADAKRHELRASVLSYRQTVLQAVAEVETALGSLQQQEQRQHHSDLAWQALQRASQSVQVRLGLQLSSPLDLAESKLAADQAALDLVDARAAHTLAYVALYKALGGAPLPESAQAQPHTRGKELPPADVNAGATH